MKNQDAWSSTQNAARKSVVGVFDAIAVLYAVSLELECGHKVRRTMTAEKYFSGYKPKRLICRECHRQLAAAKGGPSSEPRR